MSGRISFKKFVFERYEENRNLFETSYRFQLREWRRKEECEKGEKLVSCNISLPYGLIIHGVLCGRIKQ